MTQEIRIGQTRLSAWQSLGASLSTMNVRTQRRFALVVGAQMCTGLLDLAGVVLIGLVGITAVASVQGGGLPAPLVTALDRLGIGEVTAQTLAIMSAMAAATFLIGKSVAYTFLVNRIYRFLGNQQAQVSSRLAERLLSSPLSDVEGRSSQDTAFALTTGTFFGVTILLGATAIILSELALLVLLGAVLLVAYPSVTLAALTLFSIVGLTLHRLLGKWTTEFSAVTAETSVRLTQDVQEVVVAYRELFVMGRRSAVLDVLDEQWARGSRAQAMTQFIQQLPKIAYESALVIGAVTLFSWQYMTGTASEAVMILVVFLAAGSRIAPSMLRLNGQLISVRAASAMAGPFYALSERVAEAATQPLPRIATSCLLAAAEMGHPGFESHVRVESVSLTYPGARSPAINDVSFEISPGMSVAIVGGTGAGKSTLADLVLGVLAPSSGYVTVSGLPPHEAISRWPGAVSYVPQSVALINASVRQNIALGLDLLQVNDSMIWSALRQAHLDELFRTSPEGLDTRVGERGVRLSGGQRQRLGLARCFLMNPRFIVLDEATSALDAETERAIADTVLALTGQISTLTIAHRLATVQRADLVLLLEHGCVSAVGTFNEVRSASANFDLQAQLMGIPNDTSR